MGYWLAGVIMSGLRVELLIGCRVSWGGVSG